MSQLKPFKPGYYIWKYLPSKPAAAIFAILFLGISVLHLWRLCRRRAWFCIALTAGAIIECIGFGVRIKAYDDTSKLGTYIMQSAFILLAPILFSASIYITFSRIIRSVPNGESCSVTTPRKLTRFFVFGDILSLLIQVLQVAMFGLFALTSIVFHRRYQRNYLGQPLWKQQIYMLYIVSLFIMIRSIYRVIEFSQGQDGYLISHE
ncbi:RTA1 like protein-domain-containing protein [Bisporella sp. PMI_857]|nr:RTA1 like protein-domain-containing protein [Bisporella sp. PMI_857]